MNYSKALRFDERPDYVFLQNLFANLLVNSYNEPYTFDWLYDEIPDKDFDTINVRILKIKLILLNILLFVLKEKT